MIRKVMVMVLLLCWPLLARQVSFQLFIYDTETNQPYTSDGPLDIQTAMVDGLGTRYFSQTQTQRIEDGVIHLSIDVNVDDLSETLAFDQADLVLDIALGNDTLQLPMSSMPLAIVSKLADRTAQVADESVLSIDYDNAVVQVGGATSTTNSLSISGTLMANALIGRGDFIYNARGAGFNDAHSLEKNYSRSCPPNLSRDNCQYGEDVLRVNPTPFVGVHQPNPAMPFDAIGRVLFTQGEEGTGGLVFPLTKFQSLMAWDVSNASFKAGYVSRDVSVELDTFSRSAVSIGRDIATVGINSGVFGGENNSIYGDFSAIIGGENNNVTGDYSVLIGSTSDRILKGYVAGVGGVQNTIRSNYTVLLASRFSEASGSDNTLFGENNTIEGSTVFVYGSNNSVRANHALVMGDQSTVNHDRSWVINVATNANALTSASNQAIFMSDNGVAINANDYSEMLVVSGDVVADVFYGNGSQLTNISKVDFYWFMHQTNMTAKNYALGIGGEAGINNRINLGAGLRLTSDGSQAPGTLAYEGGDLVGYMEDTVTKSLLAQDTNTTYNVSSELAISDAIFPSGSEYDYQELTLATESANRNDFLVYDGTKWVPSKKTLWTRTTSLVGYTRPMALWKSNAYIGSLTLAHPRRNEMVFSNDSTTNGVSLQVTGQDSISRPIILGFNRNGIESDAPFNADILSAEVEFDSAHGGVQINPNGGPSIFAIESDGGVNLFNSNDHMDVNIPTASRMNKLMVDGSGQQSTFAHVNFKDTPFIVNEPNGQLTLQSANNATINFRILPIGYQGTSLENQVRLQITDDAEFLLSHNDAYSIGAPTVMVPDGNMVMDKGHEIGVFNAERELQTGVRFNNDSLVFVPEPLRNHNVWVHRVGLGIRAVPDTVVMIQDSDAHQTGGEDATLYIEKSSKSGTSIFRWSRDMVKTWEMTSKPDATVGQLQLTDAAGRRLFQINHNQMTINQPNDPQKELNIDGDMAILGKTLYLMGKDAPEDPGESKPFVAIDGAEFIVKPVQDASGIGFYSGNTQELKINHDAVRIGQLSVPENPTKSLEVDEGTFITNRLLLFDEPIEFKTIQAFPLDNTVDFYHSSANVNQHLSFDYDTGFETISTQDYVVNVTFQNHFSTFNTIRVDAEMDMDTQFITPNGIDMMVYNASYISVSANNVISTNSDRTNDTVNEDRMDSLTFFNDLMNGGVIDGNLGIDATLNVISTGRYKDDQGYIQHGGEGGYLVGDISEMDDIPFPFWHQTTENGVEVHYEYVITENVGIGLELPLYPLHVAGLTSTNVMINPSMNLTGYLNSNKDYLTILSEQDMAITLNASSTAAGPLVTLNALSMNDDFFGLNGSDEYAVMALHPTKQGEHSDIYIEGLYRSKFHLHDAFEFLLDDQFRVRGMDQTARLLFSFDQSTMMVADSKVGFDITTPPKNTLDVAGNMVIGESLAGTVTALPNSLMIEGQLGIGTTAPDAMTDVQGSMVQGTSSSYLGSITGLENDLVVQSQLILEDSTEESEPSPVLIQGKVVSIGGLYFNKASTVDQHELSFVNHPDRMMIGYGQGVTDRVFTIHADDYIKLNPKEDGEANKLRVNENGKVGFGIDNPETLLHIKKDNPVVKIEANQDAQLRFEANKSGVIGFSSDIPGEFILTDGDALGTEVAGADFSIDSTGNIDIGYNISGEGEAMPSHDVRLDIHGHLNATAVLKSGEVLTHMPEGSIVMWSGWTDELPDGWVLCNGLTACPINAEDYFIIGKSTTNTVGDVVGSHETKIETTSTTYSHQHESSHTQTASVDNHNHGGGHNPRVSNPSSTTSGTGHVNADSLVANMDYVSIKTEETDWDSCDVKIGDAKWGCEKVYRREYFDTRKGPNNIYTGSHTHSVNVSHNHNFSVNNERGHTHNYGSTSHRHDNATHEHVVDLQPEYYQLAFIYLEGEPIVGGGD